MPHVLWELQGTNRAEFKKVTAQGEETEVFNKFVNEKPGTLSVADYDNLVADLTGFLVWVAEPVAQTRKQAGVWVLLFLALFFVFAWRLNAAFWKDIK
jgi:ubiquinol-cytochrome c reductase cytochrome c1 subunit